MVFSFFTLLIVMKQFELKVSKGRNVCGSQAFTYALLMFF